MFKGKTSYSTVSYASKKKRGGKKVFVLVVLLVAVSYTLIWFYNKNSIESYISNSINTYNRDIKLSDQYDGGMSAESISVSGFPFSFKLKISKPVFEIKSKPGAVVPKPFVFGFNTDQDILLSSSIFGSKTQFSLPTKSSFSYMKNDGKEVKLDFTYDAPPEMNLETSRSPLIFFLTSIDANPWTSERMFKYFRSFAYNDKGTKISISGTGEKIYSTIGSVFELSNHPDDKSNRTEFHLLAKSEGISLEDKYYEIFYDKDAAAGSELSEMFNMMTEKNKSLGTLAYTLDFTYDGPVESKEKIDDFKVTLKQFAVVNDVFAVNSDGQFVKEAADPMPYGWFRVNFTNYKEAEKHYADLINLVIISALKEADRNPNMSMVRKIEDGDLDKLNQFLAKIASIYNNDKDLLVVIKREKNGQAFVGNMDVMQAAALASEIFKPAATTTPEIPAADAAPAQATPEPKPEPKQ